MTAKVVVSDGVIRYVKNTSWLLAEKVLRMFLGLFVGIWVSRYLGPEHFGLFSYAQSFVGLFAVIATFGIDGIVIRELVKDFSQVDRLLGTAFTLKMIGALIVLALLVISLIFQPSDDVATLMILLIGLSTVAQSFNVIDFYFQSMVLGKYSAVANSLTLLVSSLVKIYLIFNGGTIVSFAYVVLFDSVILAASLIFCYSNNKLSIFSWFFCFETALSLLRWSWPLLLSGVIVSIYMKVDQVMIRNILGLEAVGYYAAAVKLSEAWYFIPTVITASLFPAILNAKSLGGELYCARVQRLFDFMTLVSVAVAIIVTLFADWIVLSLFGYEYAQASDVLIIHIWGGVFVSLGLCRGKWILAENLQKYTVAFLGVGLFVNVIANYFFIPAVGINGAAYATVMAQAVGTLIVPSFFNKTRISFVMMMKSILIVPIFYRYFRK